MSTEKFVKNFYDEKQGFLKSYLSGDDSSVSQKNRSLDLSPDQSKVFESIIDDVLTDTLYTVLLGLSGSATIGDSQVAYKIFGEDGNEIDSDEIEEYAWCYFQE